MLLTLPRGAASARLLQRHAHGDLTSLAPHERLPEILVVPREKTPTGAAARGPSARPTPPCRARQPWTATDGAETPSFTSSLLCPPLPPEHVSTSRSHSGAAERPPRARGSALGLFKGICTTHGDCCRTHTAMLTVGVLNHKVSSGPEIVLPADVGPFTVGEHSDVPDGLLVGGWRGLDPGPQPLHPPCPGVIWSHHFMGMGKQWKQCQTLIFWAPKSLQMVTATLKLKDACSLEEKCSVETPLQ